MRITRYLINFVLILSLSVVVDISPGLRDEVLQRWAKLAQSRDYSRLQRSFFDTVRTEVAKQMPALEKDFATHEKRLELEKQQSSMSLKNESPLHVIVEQKGGEEELSLLVSLEAANTQLSWTVSRLFAEFKALYIDLKRFKLYIPPLPTRAVPIKLTTWLAAVLLLPEISSSRSIYSFLSIGRTVDLLALSARERDSLNTVSLRPDFSENDLSKAVANLNLIELSYEPEPGTPARKEGPGSVRARRVKKNQVSANSENDEAASAVDIQACLAHLLNLEFTDSPLREAELSLSDEEEEETQTDLNVTGNTQDTFENNSYPASPTSPSEGHLTLELDLRATIADQARTIEVLLARIAELEEENRELK